MVNLGDKVRHKVTGLEGIAIGRTDYLFGCVHVCVQPQVIKDGKPADAFWTDESGLAVIEAGAVKREEPEPAERPGGPMLGPTPPTP